ncbi:SAV_2336 N-terminal domain-related protein [Streptomyces sp. NPDC048751]|uniref:SAV_2336 N-terminal domain-related protein n=1 Tax=Streptomyces sp. NPDC048751 TaxID=3365591 RepID=UPI0037126513
MSGELRRILEAAGLDLSVGELLDALWLATRMPRGTDAPLARRLRDGADAEAAEGPRPVAPSAVPPEPATGTGGTSSETLDDPGVRPRSATATTSPQAPAPVTGAPSAKAPPGGPVRLPGGKVLGSELALGRALRPLKRRVAGTTRTVLDEDATAAAQADTGIPNVVLRPLPEPWLRLALVIDSEISMVLWERHCRELQAVLEHSGAFRQIEIHQLGYGTRTEPRRTNGPGVFLVRPWSGSRANSLPTSALNDPSGRTLIMVITDGAAPAWRDGRMRAALEQWGKVGPTSVFHVLPRHLWPGTGAAADTWHVTMPRPGSRNADWHVTDPVLPPDMSSFDRVPVPVVELTPSGLRAWATALTTVGLPVPLRLWEPRTSATPAATASPADARTFTRTASPTAVRLAAHLAAVAPVTVPVMRLVQSCLPGRTSTAALAEIFLGGLLRPVAAPPKGPMKYRLFDFTTEAKDQLLDTVPLKELVASSQRVGERVEQLVGRSPDFPAWLLGPGAVGGAEGVPQPFARLGTAMRTRLGLDELEEFWDEEEDESEDEDEPDVARERRKPVPSSPAVVILTALAVEYDAVRAHLTDPEELVHADGTRVERGRIDGAPWTVAIAELDGGAERAAAVATRIASWLRPEALIFVGVAGSLRGSVGLGDVVVGTKVYDLHGGRETPEGFVVRPRAWLSSHSLVDAARSAVRDVADVRVHFEPLAASDVLLADARQDGVRRLRELSNDAVAIEMEGSGAARAGHLNGVLDALVIRGISDLAYTDKRADNASAALSRAAAQAASVAMAVLRKHRPRDEEPLPRALTSLPLPPPPLVGREAELDLLLHALEPTGHDARQLVSVTAVSGLGGIGKTALATAAAHAALDRGWFPGGVLFVDLRGHDETPVPAGQALLSLLRALGIPSDHLPPTVEERAALYRSVLAVRDPMLILADNASSSEQIRPLVPNDNRHRLLVTSRSLLPQLGARLVRLGQLSHVAAVALLDRALRVADPSDSRITDDYAVAGQLAALCGHLPLALQIAVARLAADPGRPVASFVAALATSRDRLSFLDDGDRSLRAAFDASYRRLPPDQARLLRLLALAPAPEVGPEVAAALFGRADSPDRVLESLARVHLIERVGGAWRVPALVREYGSSLVAADPGLTEEGEAARERVLESYCGCAEAADDRLRWRPGLSDPGRFATRAEALAWLDAERAGLVTAVQWARQQRFADAAMRLAGSLTEYLSWRRHYDDWLAVATAARDATYRGGDHSMEAAALNNLGRALHEAGHVDEAIDALTRARDLYGSIADARGEAAARTNLGHALRKAGRHDEAIAALTGVREIHRVLGEPRGEALACNGLGLALSASGRADAAVDALTSARDLFAAVGDRHAQGVTLIHLGQALDMAHHTTEAIAAYSAATDLLRESEDWYRAGRSLRSLALLHAALEAPSQARTAWLRAADAYDRAGAPAEAAEARSHAEQTT